MVIEVNKDIDRYQESVAMGLTARQLIFSIASVVVGGGIVLLLYKYIRDAFFGPVTPKVPASILQLHNNVTVIVDKEAGKLIKDVL